MKSAKKGEILRSAIAKRPKLTLTQRRELAKAGMVASLATLVITAFFMRSKVGKTAHIISGALLVGFSYYHHTLYNQK